MRAFLFLALLALLAGVAAADDATVLSHELVLELDPATSSFVSHDTVQVRGPGRLHVPALEGVEVTGGNVPVPAGVHELRVAFRGRISNPVQKSEAATWVAGDRTPGTIGAAGTYLVRGFYVPSPTPVLFSVTVSVPPPHRAVAPGRLADEWEAEGLRHATYESTVPNDGLVVVTGPWVVDEERIDGVACRTYLYADDRGNARILLSTLRAEIPRYQKLFGPVPDGRFDVVENFFETGFGFANFTLLGDTVIRYVCAKTARAGGTVLPAGYLDHELVHGWLGNDLLVDYAQGNWCEALTTYFTNYGASLRDGTDAAYRRKVARSFSLRVNAENDYPVRDFKEKRHGYENDIGYGKGSMVFDMLAREVGREEFAGAVRRVVEMHGGTALGWDGLVQGLGNALGRDLKTWFSPWLDRTGAPILEIGALKVEGNVITGTIDQAQAGNAYPLRIPVRVFTEQGVEHHVVKSASKETAFRFATKSPPKVVEIDPDHEVFRRTPRGRVAPCLEAVRTAPKRVGYGDPALLGRLQIEPIKDGLPGDAAVLAVGLPVSIRDRLLAGARVQDASLVIGEGTFDFQGATYDQPGDGILFSFNRAGAPGFPVTFFHGNDKAAFQRTRYLPYYASDSWVVFRGGRPVKRGTFAGDRATRAEITKARRGPAEALVRDLLYLTDPAREGRQAGTMAAYKLANELRGRSFKAGLKPIAWPSVPIVAGKIAGPRLLTILDKDEKVPLRDSFYPFHRSASPRSAPVFKRVVEHPADDVRDAMVLLPEDVGDDVAAAYAEKGAAVVAVVSKDEHFTARGREAAWTNALPPAVKKRLSPDTSNVGLAVSGMLARAGGKPLSVPYIYLHPFAAQELQRRDAGGVLKFRIERTVQQTSNIVGVLGSAGHRGILLSAHWDGVGWIGGQPMPAAADNAAGVAIVLWVAERLKRDFDAKKLKRPVVVVLFGGEEAGLAGSRQFADLVASGRVPLAKPLAAVNVDGIGSLAGDQVYLIGRSHYPELEKVFHEARRGTGLVLGRDIDKFAFREGSDHWPLHLQGIPSVTVFSANYRAMNGPLDTVDKVDVGTMRNVAHAVYRMVRKLASE